MFSKYSMSPELKPINQIVQLWVCGREKIVFERTTTWKLFGGQNNDAM